MNKTLVLLFLTLILGLLKLTLIDSFIKLENFKLFDFDINPFFGNEYLIFAAYPLRLGLAYVFFFYGFDNLKNPLGFDNIADLFLEKLGLKRDYDFSILGRAQGGLEILIAIGLVFGFYLDLFSLLASIMVLMVLVAYQGAIGKLLLRDVGLLGGSITLFLLSLH